MIFNSRVQDYVGVKDHLYSGGVCHESHSCQSSLTQFDQALGSWTRLLYGVEVGGLDMDRVLPLEPVRSKKKKNAFAHTQYLMYLMGGGQLSLVEFLVVELCVPWFVGIGWLQAVSGGRVADHYAIEKSSALAVEDWLRATVFSNNSTGVRCLTF